MVMRIKFTKPEIKGLTLPAEGKYECYDTKVPKLAVRVTAAGSKVFYVIRRTGARVEWVKLGIFPDLTVEQARTEAEKELGKFAAGGNPAADKRKEKLALTLGQAFDHYIGGAESGKYAVKSAGELRANWERCLGKLPDLPAKKHGRKRAKHPAGVDWTDRKLDAITKADIEALHAAIGETTPILANRVVELLSAVYNRDTERNKDIDRDYIGTNPTVGIKPFKETKRDRFIQPAELPTFFEKLAADTSADFKHFVLLALLTGARRGNVLAARWEDVSLDTMLWRIPETKNGEPVTIPLMPAAAKVLAERAPKPAGWVFPAESKTGHLTPPKKRWQALCKRAKLENLTIHDLRRSLGSWQAINGASLAVIGKSLGHKSVDATMIYARLNVDPVRQSMMTATSAMLEAAGVKQPAKAASERKGRRHAKS